MATSGSIDYSMTAQNLSKWALRKIGVVSALQEPSAEDMRDAITDLNLMLKSWQTKAPNLFRQTFGSVTMVAATASYVLSPRPFRVVEARYRDANARDIPMIELTRQEYVDIPHKAASGVPTQYYVDHQRTAATIYVWPVPASVTTETIQYTFQRTFEDIDAQTNDIDIPQENLELVGYALADRLTERFQCDNAKVIKARAMELMFEAADADREAFVRFIPDY